MTSKGKLATRALIVSATLLTLTACAPVTPITATTAIVTKDPRTTGTVVEDERIESKVKDFFQADADLSQSCHLNVASYNQRVLLSGECPTPELVSKAEKYGGEVAKVRHIYNEIVVGTPSPLTDRTADSLITTGVKSKLFAITSLPSRNVKVVTEAGVVFLMGIIDKDSGDIAANTAAEIAGVVKVVKLFEHP